LKLLARIAVMAIIGITLVLSHGRPSLAQVQNAPPAPVKYTGLVMSVGNDSISLKDKDGKVIAVAMTPGWTVVTPRTLDSGALKVGDFVASTNVNIDASSGRSTEVRVLEPGYKPEENTHPTGQPNTSMTHGTVTKVDRSADGVTLVVSYPSGSRHLAVASDVKITGYDVNKRSDLIIGTMVTAVTRVGPDGVGRAARLVLGD
jgi:hypothetical protein